jgi:PPK2 family polyphosphate:nucleotide phosphotransferase
MGTIDHGDLLVPPGRKVRLSDFDPAFTADFREKSDARKKLAADLRSLRSLQDVFYADSRYALLIVFQGMDAAGKDGVIDHVMSGVSPQGVDVHSFKEPSPQELSHDYLWRCAIVLPERGRIAIFNRSYYEELTVVRVHASLLENERLPAEASATLWRDRYEDIVAFERHLVRNGTLILKFFLHVSKEEQKLRLLERIDQPKKNWKFSAADLHEREYWDNYRSAYQKLLTHTTTKEAPWYVIPADHKWFARAAVADVIVKRLDALGLAYPVLSEAHRARLVSERKRLVDADEPEPKA